MFGHVSEAAIAVLAVESIPIARIMPIKVFRRVHQMIDATAVHEEYIEQSVIVVVEKGDAAGHGFDQILLRGRRVLQSEVHSARQIHYESRRAGCGNGGGKNRNDCDLGNTA